ncbi:MAG: hypothetical protein ACPG49_08395 [Chitinophagales bacterium]
MILTVDIVDRVHPKLSQRGVGTLYLVIHFCYPILQTVSERCS